MVSPACPPAANSHSNSRLHICNTNCASPLGSQISNHERIPQSQAPHGRPHARSTVLSSSADRRRCHWPAHGRRDDLAFPRVISCSQLNCFVCCCCCFSCPDQRYLGPYRWLVTGSLLPDTLSFFPFTLRRALDRLRCGRT